MRATQDPSRLSCRQKGSAFIDRLLIMHIHGLGIPTFLLGNFLPYLFQRILNQFIVNLHGAVIRLGVLLHKLGSYLRLRSQQRLAGLGLMEYNQILDLIHGKVTGVKGGEQGLNFRGRPSHSGHGPLAMARRTLVVIFSLNR